MQLIGRKQGFKKKICTAHEESIVCIGVKTIPILKITPHKTTFALIPLFSKFFYTTLISSYFEKVDPVYEKEGWGRGG